MALFLFCGTNNEIALLPMDSKIAISKRGKILYKCGSKVLSKASLWILDSSKSVWTHHFQNLWAPRCIKIVNCCIKWSHISSFYNNVKKYYNFFYYFLAHFCHGDWNHFIIYHKSIKLHLLTAGLAMAKKVTSPSWPTFKKPWWEPWNCVKFLSKYGRFIYHNQSP